MHIANSVDTCASVLFNGFTPYGVIFVRKATALTNMIFPPLEQITTGYKGYLGLLTEKVGFVLRIVSDYKTVQVQQTVCKETLYKIEDSYREWDWYIS